MQPNNRTRKAVSVRIKVTKTGKLMRRTMGLGHNRAKKNMKSMRRKDGQSQMATADASVFRKKYGLTV